MRRGISDIVKFFLQFPGLMHRYIFKIMVVRRWTDPDTHLLDYGDVKLRLTDAASVPWRRGVLQQL
jgi:hypothetical protein